MWGEEWKLFWLLLTTQWGADESGPKRPFPSPRRRIPSLTRCTDIRKKSLRDSAPNPQKPATCPPKSTFCTALRRRVFLLPNQVLSSRHSDGPYCTGRQKKRQPSLWATDRACLDWKDFDGAKQGGGTYTGKLVSPGKPLQLSVPAQSSPSLVPCFFLPFIGCLQGSFLGKEVWLFHESLSLLLECAFLLADLEKNVRSKNVLAWILFVRPLCLSSLNLPTRFHCRSHSLKPFVHRGRPFMVRFLGVRDPRREHQSLAGRERMEKPGNNKYLPSLLCCRKFCLLPGFHEC